MAILSTGPIENLPIGGVRSTQQVTVKIANSDSANFSTVLIQVSLKREQNIICTRSCITSPQ